jgi:hypothetical protein
MSQGGRFISIPRADGWCTLHRMVTEVPDRRSDGEKEVYDTLKNLFRMKGNGAFGRWMESRMW